MVFPQIVPETSLNHSKQLQLPISPPNSHGFPPNTSVLLWEQPPRQPPQRRAQPCGRNGGASAGGTAPDGGSAEGPVAQVSAADFVNEFPADGHGDL